MDRRAFLQNLGAIGLLGHFNIPWPKKGDDSAVQEAWEALEKAPVWFDVSDSGTLSLADMGYPSSRAECLDLLDPVPQDPRQLIAFTECDWRCREVLERCYRNALEEAGEDVGAGSVADEDLESWLRADKMHISDSVGAIEEWLADDLLDEFDIEAAERHGRTPQGAALQFWSGEDMEDLENLGIEIVEGDHPGSTYFAAELRMPVEDANHSASQEGIPVRFRAG